MSELTAGPWRRAVGEIDYGAVVADTSPRLPPETAERAFYDAREVEAYGGYVIAESIAPQNLAIIAASPDLLAACEMALEALREYGLVCNTITNTMAYEALVAAVARARGKP